MDGGQEHLTEWNLGERVELGCGIWPRCQGGQLRWGGRDLQVVKNKYLLKNMGVYRMTWQERRRGLGERVCVRKREVHCSRLPAAGAAWMPWRGPDWVWSCRLGQVGGVGNPSHSIFICKDWKAVRTVQLCPFPRELGAGRGALPRRAGGGWAKGSEGGLVTWTHKSCQELGSGLSRRRNGVSVPIDLRRPKLLFSGGESLAERD